MHNNFQHILQHYIDKDLDLVETLVLEEHLATCQPCRRMLNQLKLLDWDLKNQPAADIPPELETIRQAAISAHLHNFKPVENAEETNERWQLQKHILKHTFAFVFYNPVNQALTQAIKKTTSLATRNVGKRARTRKRSSLFTRYIFGKA